MPKTSPLSNPHLFQEAVDNSQSIKEVIEYLGLRAAGGNYKQAKVWSDHHQIPLPSFDFSRQLLGVQRSNKLSNAEVFVKNSTYLNRTNVKKRLFLMGVPNVCSITTCGVGSDWLGNPLVLHLDHINGVSNDNRLENLRLLCPNCHSQTDTYCGKNLSTQSQITAKKPESKPRPTKIDWPAHNELSVLVENLGYSATGRKLGVSDNAVRKRLKLSEQESNL